MENYYDVVIVGGGPAGLAAALVLGRSCRKVLLIDAGHPRNAAGSGVNGYLGRDGTPPEELREIGRREVARYGVEIVLETVTKAECVERSLRQPHPTAFRVTMQSGRMAVGRKLLLATGVRDELPQFPGLRECYGVSVHHCPFCDGWEHRGRRLAAFGRPAEKGVGLGLALKNWSPHVIVLADGQPLETEQRRRLAAGGLRLAEQPIVRLVADAGRLRAIELDGSAPLEVDALFFSTAQQPGSDLAGRLGCEFRETNVAPLANTSPKQQTNVPGMFLAGDADGDVQFAIVAAAEGATAAVTIQRELQDEDQAEG